VTTAEAAASSALVTLSGQRAAAAADTQLREAAEAGAAAAAIGQADAETGRSDAEAGAYTRPLLSSTSAVMVNEPVCV